MTDNAHAGAKPAIGRPRLPVEPRFRERYAVDAATGCWVWTANKTRHGHGQMKANGKTMPAHRLSWELHRGPVSDDMEVCHDCPAGDNPACVNPDHLFVGTHDDNMKDMAEKGRGRGPNGETNSHAVLTEAHIREIRIRYAAGRIRYRDLAVEFGVDTTTIGNIARRETWRHVA